MSVNIDQAWVLAVFLVALRVGMILMLTPIFTNLAGLVTVRVLFTLSLSLALVAGMGLRPGHIELDMGHLLFAAMGEIFIGATLAFGIFAAFGAFSVAGKVIDIQSGFSIGTVYDPVTRGGAPLFSTMLNLVGVVAFFGMDAHHALLRGLAFSFTQVAPGTGLRLIDVGPIVRQFGVMFSLGVAVIIPVMLGLLLVEVGLAVISRVLPQMNIFVVGAPVKIFAAIGLLAMTAGSLGKVMGTIYASIFIFWEQVLS